MKTDPFETKLRDLASSLHRPDPTAAWKADILEHALAVAAHRRKPALLPPRWLLAGWAAALVAAAWLHLNTTDAVPPASAMHQLAPVPGDEPLSLLAFQTRLDQLTFELP